MTRRRYTAAREAHSRAYRHLVIDTRTGEVVARTPEAWQATAIRDRLNAEPADRPQDHDNA